MSASAELQQVILSALKASSAVHAICADRIYDGRPEGATFPNITFGPTQVMPEDAACITGRVEVVQLDCWSRDGGKTWPVKKLADAVKGALHEADLTMKDNALARISVVSVRCFLDQDGLTGHGVVTVQAEIEEA